MYSFNNRIWKGVVGYVLILNATLI